MRCVATSCLDIPRIRNSTPFRYSSFKFQGKDLELELEAPMIGVRKISSNPQTF